MKKELSVIIPAYNEEERVTETIQSVVSYLRKKGYNFEVILVNDGSTDSTVRQVRDMAVQTPELHVIDFEENRGKGTAVKTGVAEAQYSYCLFMDADNATSIEGWDKCEPLLREGCKVVVASRRLPASRIVYPQPWVRRILGGVYRVLCRRFFGLKASDLNCGFKAYETALAKKVYARVEMGGWAFDTEVFCLLKKEGVEAAEVPVTWEHRAKASALAPFRAGFATFGSLWQLKKKY